MQTCWNKLVFDRPPTTSWCCGANEFDSKGFLKIIDKVTLELESNIIFQTEAAVLSRLIYRMKSKLRSDKGLKNMEKINRALLNYLNLSLEKDYKYLKDNTECNGNMQALPSRQMLQYTLVRTQGFSKLMCRIESVARLAADFFKTRISLGQAWNISLVAYAAISRIWLLSMYLTKKSCEWYNRMYRYLNKLKIVGVSWIPGNHYFPEDLKLWLSVSWINDDLKNLPAKDSVTDSIFTLITQSVDEELVRESDVTQTNETPVPAAPTLMQSSGISMGVKKPDVTKIVLQTNTNDRVFLSLDEVGERISRGTFIADCPNETSKTQSKKRRIARGEHQKDIVENRLVGATKLVKKKAKKTKVINVDDIETKEDVVKFVSSESYPGLDKLQWKIIRKNAIKLLVKLNKFDDSFNTKKHDILLKKVIQSIREWIN